MRSVVSGRIGLSVLLAACSSLMHVVGVWDWFMETSMSVLVCGAGPTGLVTAIELARRGIDVRIVDAAPEPSQLSKAAVLWRRSLEVLHPSVPVERFTAHGRPVHGIQFEADGSVLQEIDFGVNRGKQDCFGSQPSH